MCTFRLLLHTLRAYLMGSFWPIRADFRLFSEKCTYPFRYKAVTRDSYESTAPQHHVIIMHQYRVRLAFMFKCVRLDRFAIPGVCSRRLICLSAFCIIPCRRRRRRRQRVGVSCVLVAPPPSHLLVLFLSSAAAERTSKTNI